MLSGRCSNHPDRVAVGICIVCKKVICIECSTPIEGIHRCRDCLRRMGETESAQRWQGSEWHPATLSLTLAGLGGLYLWWMLVAVIFE